MPTDLMPTPTDASEVPTVYLKRGSAKPIFAGHPWAFASAIDRKQTPKIEAGAEVRAVDARGQILGHGFFSPDSAIAIRLLTQGDQRADENLLIHRIDAALDFRHTVLGLGPDSGSESQTAATTAYRLIHSEGDGLPGLIVDRYGEYLCIQVGTSGIHLRLATILDHLENQLHPKGILDRSDPRMLRLEKLEPQSNRLLRGSMPSDPVEVHEDGILFEAHLSKGQKTGLYLDQRETRQAFASFAKGRDVLDTFAYNGAFSLHAARAGARSLTLVEANEKALQTAKRNLERNEVQNAELVCSPWVEAFRHLRDEKRNFDLVVLDPPKFATKKGNIKEAVSAYRELNGQAARMIRPGGILFSCSCSGNVSGSEFERAVASGLRQAGRQACLLSSRGAATDHPIPPGFDQGRYLKCLVLQVR